MKKLTMLFFIAIMLIISLAGCNKEKGLSDKEALNIAEAAWDNYRDMYTTIWISGLGSGNIIENENVSDILFSVEGDINTLAKVKQEIEKVCTEEFAEKNFYEPYLYCEMPIYEEIDGILCMRPVAFTDDLSADIFELVSVGSNKIQVKITGEVDEHTKLSSTNYDVIFVLENGNWLINEIEVSK